MEAYNDAPPFPLSYKNMIAKIGTKGVLILLSQDEAELVILALSAEMQKVKKAADMSAGMCAENRRSGVPVEGTAGFDGLNAAQAKMDVMKHTVKRLQAMGGGR